MTKQPMWVLAVAAALLLTLAVPRADGDGIGAATPVAGIPAGPSQHLLDLNVDSGVPGRVSVSLEADGRLGYESFVLDGPDRLVLDLHGVVSDLDQYKFRVEQSGVVRVRAAQHTMVPSPVTRVVFDLERPVAYTIEPHGDALSIEFDADVAVSVWSPRGTDETTPAAEPADLAAVIREMESRHGDSEEADAAPTAYEIRGDDPAQVISDDAAKTAAVAPSVAQPVADTTDTSETALASNAGNAGNARVVPPDTVEQLMASTGTTQPATYFQQRRASSEGRGFETRTIVTDETVYQGKPISLNLVDADIKQVFRLFHEISGLNFVLDPSVAGRVTIVLDDVPWDQALDIILKNNGLDKVLENNVIRIASTQKLAQEAAARKQLKEAKELEVEPITITRTLSYAKAGEVERVIRDSGVLTSRGKVIVDERTNTLIISDIPKKVDPLDTLISTLDSETPQVMIEARVVETSRDYVRDMGIVWGFEAIADASRGTSTGLTFPHNAAVRYGLNLPGEGGASTLAFRFSNVIDSFTLDLALSALETEGYGRVLSSPKVATQNNERAEIEQGTRIPIVNTTATEINVEFVSASLRMVVTPQITAEGTIILDVEVENNSPDFVNTAGGIPSIRTQRAQTKVLINDGGTTVIGGIFMVNEGRSEVGVPWFRKIPGLGWLFKQQNITNQNRELLIFITPKIIRLA